MLLPVTLIIIAFTIFCLGLALWVILGDRPENPVEPTAPAAPGLAGMSTDALRVVREANSAVLV